MSRLKHWIAAFILWPLVTAASWAAPCDDGLKLDFNLQVRGAARQEVRELLTSVSRLQEVEGECFRSLARIEALMKDDRAMFDRILRAEGFYGALVDESTRRTPEAVIIRLVVITGPVYPVASLTFETDPALEPISRAAAATLLATGSPAESVAIVAAENAALNALMEAGHPLAKAEERSVVVDHAARSVAVTYHLKAGPELRFGEVRFEGLDRSKTGYLERLHPWKPGDIAKPSALGEYQKRLQATGLFRLVLLDWATEPNADGTVDVIVKTEEAPPRRIELGAGYSTGEGAELEASWTHRNIGGTGNMLKLTLTAGESEQTLASEWRKPHFRRYGQTLVARGKIGREHLPAYTSNLSEAYLGIERRLNRHLVATAGAQVKATDLREDGSGDTFVLAGLPLGLAYDTTDVLLDPTRGVRVNLRLQPGISVIDDNYLFLINEVKASTYWKPSPESPLTLAGRVRLGTIAGPSQDQIPESERFFAGGGGSVRGFSYQGLGPKDADGDPVGGRSVFEMAFEARARFSETMGVVAFIDGGAIYADRWPQFNELRFGTGLGFRYYTAFAPIRIDVATPIDRRDGESAITLYIGIGQSF